MHAGGICDGCGFLYWPAGVKSRLPSTAKQRRRKKDVSVSSRYRLAFLTPRPAAAWTLGDVEGMTAGSGSEPEGAGETDRRIDGDEPNEERRLCVAMGGFIGSGRA